MIFFFASRRLHTRCALVTGVQTCALPILRTPTRIASFAAQKIVPTGVLRGVLRGVDHAAGWTAVRRDVLKAADVDELDELRTASLEKSDLLAQRVELRAMALGVSGGALFGQLGRAHV